MVPRIKKPPILVEAPCCASLADENVARRTWYGMGSSAVTQDPPWEGRRRSSPPPCLCCWRPRTAHPDLGATAPSSLRGRRQRFCDLVSLTIDESGWNQVGGGWELSGQAAVGPAACNIQRKRGDGIIQRSSLTVCPPAPTGKLSPDNSASARRLDDFITGQLGEDKGEVQLPPEVIWRH